MKLTEIRDMYEECVKNGDVKSADFHRLEDWWFEAGALRGTPYHYSGFSLALRLEDSSSAQTKVEKILENGMKTVMSTFYDTRMSLRPDELGTLAEWGVTSNVAWVAVFLPHDP